jgi:hypothetical protein
MQPTRPARWAAAIVTGLAAAMACAAAAAPAALAAPTGIGPVGGSPASLDPHRAGYPPAPVPIHTISTGMPGWQIALIAAGAAIFAAAAAVILDRARTTRRPLTPPSARAMP